MPIMNGPEATRRLREMGCSSYIIGVTGNVLAEDVDLVCPDFSPIFAGLEAPGIDDYLYSIRDLVEANP